MSDMKEKISERIAAGEKELSEQRTRLTAIREAVPQIEARINILLGAISELQAVRKILEESEAAPKEPEK